MHKSLPQTGVDKLAPNACQTVSQGFTVNFFTLNRSSTQSAVISFTRKIKRWTFFWGHNVYTVNQWLFVRKCSSLSAVRR